MNTSETVPHRPPALMGDYARFYRETLLGDIIPFWLRHGMDREHDGIITSLDRDGTILDTDKSVWFQGRAGWMFATLYNTVDKRPEWLEAARSCMAFSRQHCVSPTGKMYFTVTRTGEPLRMRRYVFSESFAAMAAAAYARATGEQRAADEAARHYETYLHWSFTPGVMPPKAESTRPTQGIGAHMINLVTAQELRLNLGEISVRGRTCSEWIDFSIGVIRRNFLKPDLQVLMETVGPAGEIIDHFEGRTLNPGHAIEAAWFILHESHFRGDAELRRMGLQILDWMWARGWDDQLGGLFYFRDLRGLPVQEYWQDMKFWWPHNEAIIATLLAFHITGESKYAEWHKTVHDWSFRHFPDPEFGEWYGYLHRDGTPSVQLKGNMWKGPFHLPRMLLHCANLAGLTGAAPV